MTIVAYIMATLLVLSFLAGIIIPSYQISRALFRFFLGDYYNLNWLRKELEPGYRAPLARHFRFYRQLSPRAKKSFERRVQKFIDQKDFSPKGGLPDVTDEMKALIAASAIQITFGLPSIYLQHFRQIYVFPESYYSSHTRQYHQGEVNSKGIIVLSWSNFVKGYIDDTNGINLGLHEMAHALRVEDIIENDEYNFFDRRDLLAFIKHTRTEAHRMVNGEPSFFRDYAATNDHEFFAVVIENFFERPGPFRQTHPELYRLTVRLLNQDPLR